MVAPNIMEGLDDGFFEGLSQQEIDQLNSELCDDLLPAADRIKYHVDKEGQKVIDKAALSKWMEEAAMASQIGNDYIPFVKETKGKVFVKQEEYKEKTIYDDEFERLLNDAEGEGDITDGDIDVLADILGCNSLLGSVDVTSCSRPGNETGLAASMPDYDNAVKTSVDMDEVNETSVEETIESLRNDDSSLTVITLNNIPLDVEQIDNITSALCRNTHVTKIEMSNCGITDAAAEGFCTALKANSTLEALSIETNKMRAKSLKEILTALAMNESLKELRIANQYNAVGAGDEMAMCKLVGNTSLTKLSMNWRNTGSRNTSDRFIMRNTDLARKKRQGIA